MVRQQIIEGGNVLPNSLERLARLLETARRNNCQITHLPADLVPTTEDEAYRVADIVAQRLGWSPLGWKIAGTTAHVREELKLSGPIYGRSFARFATTSPAAFAMTDLLDPMVECEFFVTLRRDLPPRPEPWTLSEIIDTVATVHAGIEVAEVRFPLSAPPPMSVVFADGSASGRYVQGDELPNWREGLSDVEVVLEVDGETIRTGRGSDVMGDPLYPVLWLANVRSRWGDGLRAGEVISTGSTTGIVPVRAGQRFRALFDGHASVEVAFDS